MHQVFSRIVPLTSRNFQSFSVAELRLTLCNAVTLIHENCTAIFIYLFIYSLLRVDPIVYNIKKEQNTLRLPRLLTT